MVKNGSGKLSQWAKIKIVCKVVRGKLQKAHTMGYLTVPGQEVNKQVRYVVPGGGVCPPGLFLCMTSGFYLD